MATHTAEHAAAVLGVPGRMHNKIVRFDKPDLWANQKWISEARPIKGYGDDAKITVEMRFDDGCKNGHNTFAITAEVRRPGRRDIEAGGCLHDDIAQVFPELASLIKWHLCSSDGPMHYVANTVYHAGDRDHYGKRAGEVLRRETTIVFGENPIRHYLPSAFIKFLKSATAQPGRPVFDFEVIGIDHKDRATYDTKYTFGGFADKWHECPFNNESEALRFLEALQRCDPRFVEMPTAWSEGKARDLATARDCAIWPEATDEQLCAEPDELRAALEARLPGLLADFRAAIEGAGLAWAP